jgi:hypothetical protein
MLRIAVCVLAVLIALCSAGTCAYATPNQGASWALHYAGNHDAKVNTCSFTVDSCMPSGGEIVVDAPAGVGRYDIYIVALQTHGIAGTQYGICCDGHFYFYGWTKCSVLEISTAGWPGCGEGNSQTWTTQQPQGNVTVGILDVYVYGSPSSISACVHPEKGYAQWCDGTQPNPVCLNVTEPQYFGTVAFGGIGYNSCIWDYVESHTWGEIKALYKER